MPLRIPNLDSIKNNPATTLIGEALEALTNGLETVGVKAAMNPQGNTNAPAPPSATAVTANASGIHRISITDNSPRTRQVHYFHEWDTDPAFGNPQTAHLGVARQVSIPIAMGSTPVYHRVYCQYPDGDRSPIVYLGSSSNPTGVVDGSPTPGPVAHPTTGSGTASGGGHGFGREAFVSSPSQPGKPPKIW
jgi:hypothetical protein